MHSVMEGADLRVEQRPNAGGITAYAKLAAIKVRCGATIRLVMLLEMWGSAVMACSGVAHCIARLAVCTQVYDTVQAGNAFPMLVSSKVSAAMVESSKCVAYTKPSPAPNQCNAADKNPPAPRLASQGAVRL
jgi:hypothetical protein